MSDSGYGDPPASSGARSGSSRTREIRFEHSRDLADLLSQLEVSILISTYQAEKIAVLNSIDGQLDLQLFNYDRPMGMAVDHEQRRLAVATHEAIWVAFDRPDVAADLASPHDRCFLTRGCHLTGRVAAHQVGWSKEELCFVNTAFSCLCTIDQEHSFRPIWRPHFITALKPEDRCHLNGMAVLNGTPKYVTALATSDLAEGWRETKATSGLLMDVESNSVVVTGLSMPHSPVARDELVFLLNSGCGSLVCVDPKVGRTDELARFPGYTRGLSIHRDWAVVGLSRIRESANFGGLPISKRRDELKCGVAIVNLRSGQLAGQFEFKSGVDEIFDVLVLPCRQGTTIRGPFAREDGFDDVWLVPSFPSSNHE